MRLFRFLGAQCRSHSLAARGSLSGLASASLESAPAARANAGQLPAFETGAACRRLGAESVTARQRDAADADGFQDPVFTDDRYRREITHTFVEP